MPTFWILETSTERGVLALAKDQEILFSKELPVGYNQSKFLMPELAQIMQSIDRTTMPLNAISVGIGPGSYTGIRIGAAVAKALAYAWELPLIGFCTLEAFIPNEEGDFAAIIDAKMSGAYVLKGRRDSAGQVRYNGSPFVCPLDQLRKELEGISLLVTPYAKNLKPKVDHLHAEASWEWQEVPPSISHMSALVIEKYERKEWHEGGQIPLLYLRESVRA